MAKTSAHTIDGRKLYDYSDRLIREEGIRFLLSYAAREKAGTSAYWRRMRDYYDGVHDTARSLSDMLGGTDIPFAPAQCTDGFIHVESQIDTSVPSFEFVGRGRDDAGKAYQRSKIVDYIASRSPMERMNSENERRLGILGTAVWKVAWDSAKDGVGQRKGRRGRGGGVQSAPVPAFPRPVVLRYRRLRVHSLLLHAAHLPRIAPFRRGHKAAGTIRRGAVPG